MEDDGMSRKYTLCLTHRDFTTFTDRRVVQ